MQGDGNWIRKKKKKQLLVRKEFIPANHQLLFKIYLEE